MKVFNRQTQHIEETENPALRTLLGTMAKDDFSNISFYNEDNSGEIEIYINETFKNKLETLYKSLSEEFIETDCECLDDYCLEELPILKEFLELVYYLNNNSIVYYDTY